MDGLDDAPYVSARIPDRKVKEFFVKWKKKQLQ
jgi:hypothetical protein